MVEEQHAEELADSLTTWLPGVQMKLDPVSGGLEDTVESAETEAESFDYLRAQSASITASRAGHSLLKSHKIPKTLRYAYLLVSEDGTEPVITSLTLPRRLKNNDLRRTALRWTEINIKTKRAIMKYLDDEHKPPPHHQWYLSAARLADTPPLWQRFLGRLMNVRYFPDEDSSYTVLFKADIAFDRDDGQDVSDWDSTMGNMNRNDGQHESDLNFATQASKPRATTKSKGPPSEKAEHVANPPATKAGDASEATKKTIAPDEIVEPSDPPKKKKKKKKVVLPDAMDGQDEDPFGPWPSIPTMEQNSQNQYQYPPQQPFYPQQPQEQYPNQQQGNFQQAYAPQPGYYQPPGVQYMDGATPAPPGISSMSSTFPTPAPLNVFQPHSNIFPQPDKSALDDLRSTVEPQIFSRQDVPASHSKSHKRNDTHRHGTETETGVTNEAINSLKASMATGYGGWKTDLTQR